MSDEGWSDDGRRAKRKDTRGCRQKTLVALDSALTSTKVETARLLACFTFPLDPVKKFKHSSFIMLQFVCSFFFQSIAEHVRKQHNLILAWP